jgi:transposase
MAQRQLPVFPDGIIPITAQLSCGKQDGRVIYFHGALPVFSHAEADRSSFRMITAQFCVSGAAKQAEIVRAFRVTTISLKRAVKRYREQGPKGFYTPRPSRGAAVLTPAVLAQAQQLFDEGLETTAVAQRLGLKRDTLAKAVAAGRLHQPSKKKPARWC